jgi:hypothetical protein
MKIIYKHKKTYDLVLKRGDYFHFLTDDYPSENKIPADMVIGSNDWELISNNGRDGYELLLDDDKQIYFKSIITGREYRIGDDITIDTIVSNISFGDNKLNFKIGRWYFGSYPPDKNVFTYIYAVTQCDERGIHLNDVIVKSWK